MGKFILVAETGSDIPAELAAEYGIYLAPMHVSMGDTTKDDGAFPVQDVVTYYKTTGKLPKTSGCTPEDFIGVFDRIHAEHPDKHIIHLAYSAVTTCSYQSALVAAEGRDYVTSIDTKQVSAGQAAIVLETAKLLRKQPDMSLDEVIASINVLIDKARMAFVPDTLEFLHAGGRLSNASFVVGKILNIHPRVELKDGYLVATKKYRGKMLNLVSKLICEMDEMYHLRRDRLWLITTPGLAQEIRDAAEQTAKELGFEQVCWIPTGCVITTHGGPGAFGLGGFAE